MRGEDDGDAARPQAAHQLPHVAAQADIDAGGGLVEEEELRLMAQRLGDHHAALHAARQLDDARAAFIPEREVTEQLLDEGGGRALAGQTAAEAHRVLHGGEDIERDLLRHESDHRARGAILLNDVVPIHEDLPRAHGDQAADDADERRFAGTVGAEQREYFALPYREIDFMQCDLTRFVRFRHGGNG